MNLLEQAKAIPWDYDFGNLNYVRNGDRTLSIRDIPNMKTVLTKYYNRTNEDLSLIKLKSSNNLSYLILCRTIETIDYSCITNTPYGESKKYQMIAAMLLSRPTMYRELKNELFREVKAVEVHRDERRIGYGEFLYTVVVNDLKYNLVGDSEQYKGVRELWVTLSKDPDFRVSIVDLSKGMKIIDKNVVLRDALDPRIWTDEKLSLEGTKKERKIARFYRLILTNIQSF